MILPFDNVFSHSGRYRALEFCTTPQSSRPASVLEHAGPRAEAFKERHIQCIWYDSALRPDCLCTTNGEPVNVLDPGRWNLESGPDFLDASLSIGKDKTILKGDVEVHINPRDWDSHGHSGDPAYSRVIAHICLRNGPVPEGLPGCAVQIALQEQLKSSGCTDPEDIDAASYPYSTPSPGQRKCARPFSSLTPDRQQEVLTAAGNERLRLKSCRMARLIEMKGRDQVLYEETMAALGYKHNRSRFRELASLLSIEHLRNIAKEEPVTAYALLMGKSGLLPHDLPIGSDKESADFLRILWDLWWRHESSLTGTGKTISSWRMDGIRPQNRPERRLAAAACIFSSSEPVSKLLGSLECIPYWEHRLTFGGRIQDKAAALIGADRKAAIITNILVPFLAACGEDITQLIANLPRQDLNSITREMLNRLLGGDYNPAAFSNALAQQGLIQIFGDYCLDKNAACAKCKFAQALQDLSASS